MNVHVEAARFVEARFRHVQEALVGQERVFRVEWFLVNGIQRPIILVVKVSRQIAIVEVLEYFERHVQAAVLRAIVYGIGNCTA